MSYNQKNLVNAPFQAAKLNLFLLKNSDFCVFERYSKNQYKEYDYTPETMTESFEIPGIFHVQSSFQYQTNTDAAYTRSKKQPMILTDCKSGEKVKIGDIYRDRNGNIYKVVDGVNINELNICYEISLELVLL